MLTANPTNGLVDIAMVRRIADNIGEAQDYVPIVACDNTLLGHLVRRQLPAGWTCSTPLSCFMASCI